MTLAPQLDRKLGAVYFYIIVIIIILFAQKQYSCLLVQMSTTPMTASSSAATVSPARRKLRDLLSRSKTSRQSYGWATATMMNHMFVDYQYLSAWSGHLAGEVWASVLTEIYISPALFPLPLDMDRRSRFVFGLLFILTLSFASWHAYRGWIYAINERSLNGDCNIPSDGLFSRYITTSNVSIDAMINE